MPAMNMIQALNSALDVMLTKDPNVLTFGEDVGYFGGVFRVTEGLQKKHGLTRALVAAGDIAVSDPPPGVKGLKIAIAPLENPDNKPRRFLLLRPASA